MKSSDITTILAPGFAWRRCPRGLGDRGPLARDGQKKVSEGVDDLVVGQAFADLD
jgi:hypothetical protein